ncbi:unnamed protein product [Adineta steineri]|uniref:Transmembrane protein 45B n=1 Tax=Adineta steineri TaxID=433720 RepID=A0A819E742_9BILA|nr:unnamed protein product [Adineta steineri]CAF3845563.1 unnamed protein product [Adineta steineri]
MGTFAGHLIPGTIFLILSFWWTYSAWLRYFVCRQRKQSYHVSLTFPLQCCGRRVAALPIEALFIIISTGFGIATELSIGFHHRDGHISFYMGANSYQHIATYMMFFLVGIIDLLIHCRVPIPEHLSIVAVNVAFAAEAISFYFHGHGRSPIEVQLHVFLALAICASIICGTFEIIQREKQIYATLMRAYCTFLQGSWFYTVGFFLYSPFHAHYEDTKDLDEHRNSMLIAYYFVLHMAIGMCVLILFALPAYYMSKRNQQAVDSVSYERVPFVNNDDNEDNVNNHCTQMEKLNVMTNI